MATISCCDVFREHFKQLCRILHIDSTTLACFAIALFSKDFIDLETKSEVLRIKGLDGADALLSHVLLKLQANPQRFTVVLEIVLAEDALFDVGKEMESKLHSRQSLTVCNRRIPIIEAPTTDAIRFAKHLKSVYEELVDVIYDAVKNVDVGKLRVRLNAFFTSDDHTNDDDIAMLCKLRSCETSEDVFNCLMRANFIGYLNYKLLQVFAKASFNQMALKSIDDYEIEYLKLFKCDFPSLIKLFRNPRLTAIPPVSLPEFTVRLGTADDQSDLYSFKEFFENRFSWAEHLLILDIVENCILIKYGVLPFFVSAVVRDLTDPAIIEELKKEDITIELSPQLKDIARHHDHQLALEVLPSLHDISSSDVSLFLRCHDLAITDTQKSQLQTMTAVTYTDSHKDESQVGTIVSEDSTSIAKAAELEDLPMKKLITDWDEHGETSSSSGFHDDLQSLDLHIKEDASLAEKVFVYEKALKQLLEERKSIGTKNEMYKRMIIELKGTNLKVASLNDELKVQAKQIRDLHQENLILDDENENQAKNYVKLKKEINAKEQEHDTKEEEMRLTIDKLRYQNEAVLQELKEQLYSTDTPERQTPKMEMSRPDIHPYTSSRRSEKDSSNPPPPTVDSMCKVLKDLVDWERLVQHIPDITSERIQLMIHNIKLGAWSSSSSLDIQKYQFFYQWLSHHPNLSWNDVIDVLMKAHEYKSAIIVDDRYPYIKYIGRPTVSNVNSLLDDLVNWELFALYLPNITLSAIDRIKQDLPSVHDRKHVLFQYWLSEYPNASWDDVVQALYRVGERRLAQNVMKMQSPHPLLLHRELKTLNIWEKFGLQLTGITSHDIEHIKSQYNDLPSRRLALYHKWISKSQPEPLWEDVVKALVRAGEYILAGDIHTKWCT